LLARVLRHSVDLDPGVDAFPSYTPAEFLADRVVHWIGVVASVAGAVAIVVTAAAVDRPLMILGTVLYGVGLVAMLGLSALYNMTPWSPRKALYQRLDHAAIFIMIAGSYTPFSLHVLSGAEAAAFLGFVWLVALLGAAGKLWAPHRLARVSTLVYLLLGWSGLIILRPIIDALSTSAFLLLVAGGLLYSLGTLFHHWDRLPFQNVIWHGFVAAAAACHYAAILTGVVLA
jgi:hemolysin III